MTCLLETVSERMATPTVLMVASRVLISDIDFLLSAIAKVNPPPLSGGLSLERDIAVPIARRGLSGRGHRLGGGRRGQRGPPVGTARAIAQGLAADGVVYDSQ